MIKLKTLIVVVLLGSTLYSYSQNKTKKFRDSIDGAIDLSDFLAKKNGVLPIMMPITEPAIGFGALVGGIRFVPKKEPNQDPDMIVAFAGLTTNSTWLAGGGYIGYWKKDKIRYRGFMGYSNVNLKYYAFEDNRPVDFNMSAFLFSQQLNFRIKESNFFIGAKYQLAKIKIPIFDNGNLPDIDPIDYDLWNSGISVIAEHDNLNNFLTPTKGLRVHLSYDQNLEMLGSSKNWGKINFFTFIYLPVNNKWISAFRVASELATGDIPFFAKPYISLRGVPALRYQGALIIVVETEQTYKIATRWDVLGFTGIGTAFETVDNMNSEEIVWNAGIGTRYLIAKALGLKIGVDIARGPEDYAFYVTIGTSWLK